MSMVLMKPTGIIPALSTPTDDHGELDEPGLRSVVKFNICCRVQGLGVSIIAGEFYKFSDEERMRCYDVAVDEANGKTPVWVGVSHLGTAPAVALTKYAKNVGADGIIVMPPLAGNKESTLALNEHFRTVIEKADVPVMIQDPEDFNGVVLNLTLCSKLAMEYDNLVSIKVEGGNTLEKIEDIRRLIGDRVTILGGMSGRDLFEELDRGAHGNVPDCCLSDLLVGAFENYRARNMDRAKEFFSRLQPWLDFVSLHPLLSHEIEKETLRLRDVIKSSHTRSPHVPMSKEAKAQLAVLVKNMGLKNPDM